jgi:hypothetical protein
MTARKFNADIMGRLGEASPDEIRAALAAIREDYQAYGSEPASQANVDALGELKTHATALQAELTGRAALANDQAATLADLDALTNVDDDGNTDDGNTDEAEGTGDDAPADQPGVEAQNAVNDTHSQDAPGTDGGDNGGDGNVTASGRTPQRRRIGTAGTQATNRAARRALEKVVLKTTAAAGLASHNPGQDMTRQDVWQAFASKLGAVRSNAPGRERYPVVTVRSEFADGRMLRRGSTALANMERVEGVVDDARSRHARDNAKDLVTLRSGPAGANALTAAGLCAPLETLYDIRVIGDTDRPIRDALVRFGAERGGIQYRPAMDGVTQTGGIGVWTVANDEADPLVPKTCVEIACPGIVTAEIEAIYQCLTFSNMSTRFDPEAMDAVIRSQAIAHARFAENRLYGQLLAGSKDIWSTRVLGAVRDILATLDQMIAYYRNVHRLADETPLRWIAPLWALYLMRADMVRQMVGDGMQALAVTDAMIGGWLSERNINVTWHLDGIDPADLTVPTPDVVVPAQFYTLLADEAAVPGFPDAISTVLFAEGDWLHLDGGTLDLGVVRDSTLNADNRFQTFSESFEFPAFRGIESIHLIIAAQPTGQSAATKDTNALVD